MKAKIDQLLKPIDIKRAARVEYKTVIDWIETGHPRAGILPSIDLAKPGKRHSYRIHPDDWAEFQVKLTTTKKKRTNSAPLPRSVARKKGRFAY